MMGLLSKKYEHAIPCPNCPAWEPGNWTVGVDYTSYYRIGESGQLQHDHDEQGEPPDDLNPMQGGIRLFCGDCGEYIPVPPYIYKQLNF